MLKIVLYILKQRQYKLIPAGGNNVELEECIMDSIDEAMKKYIESEEYRTQRTEINNMLTELRSALNPEQQNRLNKLVDAINISDGKFASKAYVTGVVNGIALREKTL